MSSSDNKARTADDALTRANRTIAHLQRQLQITQSQLAQATAHATHLAASLDLQAEEHAAAVASLTTERAPVAAS